MHGIIEEIVVILLLILLNGFFAAAEVSLLAVRPSRVKELVKHGRPGAKILEELKKHPVGFLSTAQVGMTLVGTLASVVSGARVVNFIIPFLQRAPWQIARDGAEPIAIVLVAAAVGFLMLVIGELVPKYAAVAHPGQIALRIARPLRIFSWIAYPVVKTLTMSSMLVARLLGIKQTEHGSTAVTDEELKLLALEGSRHGKIDHTERRLVHAALSFTHIVARNIMTPRTELSAIDIEWDTHKILRTIVEEGYSRYPVYRGDLDKIVGILYTKDVTKRLAIGKIFAYEDMVREPYFVPDSMPIGELLDKFQAKHTHLAIVLDEFGGTAGLITLEDVLEEIVGEIRDEHDEEARLFLRRGEHEAIVSGQLTVEDFNDYFGAELPTEGAGTMGGLLTEELGHIPKRDDTAAFGPITLRVLRADSRRVLSLRATRETPSEAD